MILNCSFILHVFSNWIIFLPQSLLLHRLWHIWQFWWTFSVTATILKTETLSYFSIKIKRYTHLKSTSIKNSKLAHFKQPFWSYCTIPMFGFLESSSAININFTTHFASMPNQCHCANCGHTSNNASSIMTIYWTNMCLRMNVCFPKHISLSLWKETVSIVINISIYQLRAISQTFATFPFYLFLFSKWLIVHICQKQELIFFFKSLYNIDWMRTLLTSTCHKPKLILPSNFSIYLTLDFDFLYSNTLDNLTL